MRQRGPSKQTRLRHVRRAQAGHAALAFYRFDHGRLFTADVGTGTTAQFNLRHVGHRWIMAKFVQLSFQQVAAAVVFVAQIKVDFFDAHDPSSYQHAFQKSMRIALQIGSIFEGARLALVDVHHHQTGAWLRLDDAPLAPRGEARATQSAQGRVFHRFNDRLDIALARHALCKQRIAALGTVCSQVDKFFRCVPNCTCPHRVHYRITRRPRHWVLPHHGGGSLLTSANARRCDHAHIPPEQCGQLEQQSLRARHLA